MVSTVQALWSGARSVLESGECSLGKGWGHVKGLEGSYTGVYKGR